MITSPGGYRVSAPVQSCPSDASKKMVTPYGLVSGTATASESQPLARNTSSKFDIGRNFSNKLWNASRFAISNLEGANEKQVSADDLAWEDRWILSRLAQTAQVVTEQLEGYKFSEPGGVLYRFFWNELCDWYLEILKGRFRSSEQGGTGRAVLAYVMDGVLRLLHPIMPFITEGIYQELQRVRPNREIAGLVELGASDDLITAKWPEGLEGMIDHQVEEEMTAVQMAVRLIRDVRQRYKVNPREGVVVSAKAGESICHVLSGQGHIISQLAQVTSFEADPATIKPDRAAVALEEEMEIYVHDVIDIEAERSRLTKQQEDVGSQIERVRQKLSNENFVNRAKPEIVQQQRDRLIQLEEQFSTIEKNVADLG
ncbi:MAG: class I tRNA ligase family protein [Planctomycetes bacterium]|nr:class I tRNA ligase family protein [Planctomycetota bacterium]